LIREGFPDSSTGLTRWDKIDKRGGKRGRREGGKEERSTDKS